MFRSMNRRHVIKAGAAAGAIAASSHQFAFAAQDAAPGEIVIPDSGVELPTDDITLRWIDSGDLKAISFHGDVRVGIVPLDQVRGFGDPDELFFNVNTPDDLARAEALCRQRG